MMKEKGDEKMPRITPLTEHYKNLPEANLPHIKASRLIERKDVKWLQKRSATARPLKKPSYFPSSVDYSPFIHFVREQGAWACGQNALAACWDIHNERHGFQPSYAPNISANRINWARKYEEAKIPIPIPNSTQTVNTYEEYLMTFGCPTEGTELTDSDAMRWPFPESDYEAPNWKLKALPLPIQVNVTQLKIALVKKGPLRVGIWNNHYVALIGFDDATQKFKFINSWGDRWGDNGLGFVDYANLDQEIQGAEFFDFVIKGYPPTARIAFNSNYRQDIYLWLGVENQTGAKQIWPSRQRQDISKNLNLTVTLPPAFQWPPSQGNRIYLDVFASAMRSEHGVKITEFTAAFQSQVSTCNQLAAANTIAPHELKRFYIG